MLLLMKYINVLFLLRSYWGFMSLVRIYLLWSKAQIAGGGTALSCRYILQLDSQLTLDAILVPVEG